MTPRPAFVLPATSQPTLHTAVALHSQKCTPRGSFFGAALRSSCPFFPSASPAPARRLPVQATGSSPSEPPSESSHSDENSDTELMRSLGGTQLKWAEIPFQSVNDELAAIDEYESEEKLSHDDPWPKFLRGAAYEHWGQPKLALAQYAKTSHAGGLKRVPELWERRGYNSFKVGNVELADECYDIGLGLFRESTGNELHFVHWFYQNFENFVPKKNGPPAPIQRAICKYCVGKAEEARGSLMAQLELRKDSTQHALLWFMACSVKASKDGIIRSVDDRVVAEALEAKYQHTPRLDVFVKLFCGAARGDYNEVTAAETALSEVMGADTKDDVTSHVYCALYHDAFTKDIGERDRALDAAIAVGSTAYTFDMENFLFHVAQNRLSVPPNGEPRDAIIRMSPV